MASLRTLLRLQGGGARPPSRLLIQARCCATAEAAAPTIDVEYNTTVRQDRIARPLRSEVDILGKSRVLRALSSTWKPLTNAMAHDLRSHDDEFVREESVESDIELLAEEAAAFISQFHKIRVTDPFPWKDPRKAPKELGQRLLWHADRLDVASAKETREKILKANLMTQHMENRFLDMRLMWVLAEAEETREKMEAEGKLDADAALVLRSDLGDELASVWEEVAMKDSATYGLYVCAWSRAGMMDRALEETREILSEGTQLPINTYQYLLSQLPASWQSREPHPSDEGKVADVVQMLERMTETQKPVQPDASVFQMACQALQQAGVPGAKTIFSIMEEMDHCLIEPTLGTYFYIFDAAMNHLQNPEILVSIADRLASSKSKLKVKTKDDLRFLNLAIQQLALSGGNISKETVQCALKLVEVAAEHKFEIVSDPASLLNDFARVVGHLDSVSVQVCMRLVDLVEQAIGQNIFLNFHTFSLLGVLAEGPNRSFSASLYCRSFNALKRQLILQQFKIVPPVLVRYSVVFTDEDVHKRMVRTNMASIPLMENFLEDFKLFDFMQETRFNRKFNVKDEDLDGLKDYPHLQSAIHCFKSGFHALVANRAVSSEMADATLDVFKQALVLSICLGDRPSHHDMRMLATIAVTAQRVETAIQTISAMLKSGTTIQPFVLGQLQDLVMQGTNEDHLLKTLAIIAVSGIRLPVTTYQQIGAQFQRPLLMTALWMSEHTNPPFVRGAGEKLNIDLLSAWPHVYELVKSQRESIDDFLQQEQDSLDGRANLKDVFDRMVLKNRISPLDTIEKESGDSNIVEVFDASTDADAYDATAEDADSTAGDADSSAGNTAAYRGSKSFVDGRKKKR